MANRGSVDGREAWSAAEEESQAFSTPLATFGIPPRLLSLLELLSKQPLRALHRGHGALWASAYPII